MRCLCLLMNSREAISLLDCKEVFAIGRQQIATTMSKGEAGLGHPLCKRRRDIRRVKRSSHFGHIIVVVCWTVCCRSPAYIMNCYIEHSSFMQS